jgi:hypothetical protein
MNDDDSLLFRKITKYNIKPTSSEAADLYSAYKCKKPAKGKMLAMILNHKTVELLQRVD